MTKLVGSEGGLDNASDYALITIWRERRIVELGQLLSETGLKKQLLILSRVEISKAKGDCDFLLVKLS